MAPKIRHCFYCGKELGVSSWSDPYDNCGSPECARAARDAEQGEREEAHEQLDRDLGY